MGKGAKDHQRMVKLAIQGNNEAISKVIEQYYEDVLYFAISKVGRQEGEDVAQRAIESIIDSMGSLKDPSKVKAWMLTITKYRCMDYLRDKQRTANLVIDEGPEEGMIDEIVDEDREFLPEEAFYSKELRGVVLEVINTLPENYADCIRLKYAEDLSASEIAEVLEVDAVKVKNDLYHGKRLFKRRFEERTGEEYQYSALAFGATPLLSQIFEADCAEVITPAMAERVLDAANNYLASKAASVGSTSAVAAATKGLALSIGSVVAGAALITVVVASGVSLAAQTLNEENSTLAATQTRQVEHEINTLSDMIGNDNAGLLVSYESRGVEGALWQDFIQRISAVEEERATESDFTYHVYTLQKQDKQLTLYTQEDLQTGAVRVLYDFGPETDPPYMMEVLLMFS